MLVKGVGYIQAYAFPFLLFIAGLVTEGGRGSSHDPCACVCGAQDEYSKFISERGGSTNAYTASENTNYSVSSP